MKQLFRSITGNPRGRNHIDLWLGSRLSLPHLTSTFYHLKGRAGRGTDSTPQIFKTALKFVLKSLEDGIFMPNDIEEVTTKILYSCFIEDLPTPISEQKYTERDWPLIWKRVQSGVLSPAAKSHFYLLAHERVGTRERGNRLMPGRYPSSQCPRCCLPITPETILHRYVNCFFVNEAWEWLRAHLTTLDICLDLLDDSEFISLTFPKGLQEHSVLWMLSLYIEIVEREVVLKQHKLDLAFVIGFFKQKKQLAKTQAMPDIGIIPGLEPDQRGIG